MKSLLKILFHESIQVAITSESCNHATGNDPTRSDKFLYYNPTKYGSLRSFVFSLMLFKKIKKSGNGKK